MATGKKSFLLYVDLIHTFENLTDEEAGKLIKLVFQYVNDFNPVVEDKLLKIAFEPIKQALKRDLKKYENIVEKRSAAGKKSAELKANKSQQVLTSVDKSQQIQQVSTNSTVSDIVIDNDIVINNSINKSSKLDPSILKGFINFFNSVSGRNFKSNEKIKSSLKARLKDYSKDEIKKAIVNAHNDTYHKETNYKYLTPEFILRPDKLDRFLNVSEKQSNDERPGIYVPVIPM